MDGIIHEWLSENNKFLLALQNKAEKLKQAELKHREYCFSNILSNTKISSNDIYDFTDEHDVPCNKENSKSNMTEKTLELIQEKTNTFAEFKLDTILSNDKLTKNITIDFNLENNSICADSEASGTHEVKTTIPEFETRSKTRLECENSNSIIILTNAKDSLLEEIKSNEVDQDFRNQANNILEFEIGATTECVQLGGEILQDETHDDIESQKNKLSLLEDIKSNDVLGLQEKAKNILDIEIRSTTEQVQMKGEIVNSKEDLEHEKHDEIDTQNSENESLPENLSVNENVKEALLTPVTGLETKTRFKNDQTQINRADAKPNETLTPVNKKLYRTGDFFPSPLLSKNSKHGSLSCSFKKFVPSLKFDRKCLNGSQVTPIRDEKFIVFLSQVKDLKLGATIGESACPNFANKVKRSMNF